MFWTKRITYIYWPIDYTTNIGLFSMFWIKEIAYIYWPIDYITNIEFV